MCFLAIAIRLLCFRLWAGPQAHTADAAAVGLQDLSPQAVIIERFAYIRNAPGIFYYETGNGREIVGLELFAQKQFDLADLCAAFYKIAAVPGFNYLALLMNTLVG